MVRSDTWSGVIHEPRYLTEFNANVPDVIQERTHPGRAIRTMVWTTCTFFKHFEWSMGARFVTRMDISMK